MADLERLILKRHPPVLIQLNGRPAWLAHSLDTGTTEHFCSEIDSNHDAAEVVRKFISKLVRQSPEVENPDILFSKLPNLTEDTVNGLSESDLEEVARQYIEGSSEIIKPEICKDYASVEQLKSIFLERARERANRNADLIKNITESTSLNSLFGPGVVADLANTQRSVSAMKDHIRNFDFYPSHKMLIPEPIRINAAGADMLSALQELSESSIEQLDLLLSQRDHQALQSETLANMNTSLVSMVEGTAKQAYKAERSARWALIVAAVSLLISAADALHGYFKSESDALILTDAISDHKKYNESIIRLLESSNQQRAEALAQQTRNQAKNDSSQEVLQQLMREIVEQERKRENQ